METLKDMLSAAWSQFDSQVFGVIPEDDASSLESIDALSTVEPARTCEDDQKVQTGEEACSLVPTAVLEEDSRHLPPDTENSVASEPTIIHIGNQNIQREDEIYTEACTEFDGQMCARVRVTVLQEDSTPDSYNFTASEPVSTCTEDLKMDDEENIGTEIYSEVDSQVPTTVPEEDSRHSLPDYCSEVDSQVPTTVPEEDSRHSLPDYCSEVDSQVPKTVPEEDSRHSLPDSENLTGSEPITACREDMEEEGRRVYEREFLVNLRYTPESVKFPQNVPILNCFKGPKNLRKKEKKKKSKKSESAEVTPPSEVDVLQLNWTDNPWKPRFMQILCNRDQAEVGDVQETYRKVRGVLNKVTAQKFTTFMAIMSTLSIDGKEEMENLVNLIYKRAVDEPLYCRVYAQMCKVLSVLLIPAQRRHRGANFCQLLLNRCQIEFQKDPEVEIRREDWFTQIKAALDPWEREELKFNFDEEERRIRMRFVGNVRFMAEIFKLEMIAIATMHCCIMYLIQAGDEISLECLCVLLTHAGRYMESKHEDLSLYFALMKSICEIRVSNRLRFMLMDVTELRQNKWKPRNNAKLVLQEFTLQPSKARQRKIKKATLERDILQRPSDTVSITESDNLDSSSVQSECVPNSTTVQSDSVLVSEDKQIQNVGLAHEEELYKIVHDVLNKQTADKFTELVGLLTEHNRRNLAQLQGIVIIIYEKAMEEPNFSVAYAQLCRTLSEMEVTLEKEYEHLIQTVNFKKLLVEHCESEFRKNSEVKLMRESRMKEIGEISDMAVVKKLLCDLEEEDHIRQIKFQSHVRFIGDLYKVGMLTKKIVRFYIYRLLKEENEESLECLCILFTTAGKDMESDNMDLSKYFTKIKEICDVSSELPERIRFMLQDLIKLRQSWVPQSNLNLEPSVVEQEKVLNPEPLLVEQDKSLNLEPSVVEQEKVLDQQSLLSALGTSDQQDGDAPLGQESSSSMPSGESREVGGASVPAQEEEKLDPVKVNNDKVLQKLHKMANKLDLAVPDRLDKFTELATQIEVLSVGNTHELQLLVDLVHEKALNEPAYYNQYTKISKVLSEMIVIRDKRRKNEAKHVTFAELLRKRCQLELEKVSHIELNRTERLREIEAIADMNNKRELQLRLEKETQMLRMRAVANIRFIGELYKYGIINVNTLYGNIGDLLNGYDEISLECLCVLFTSVGRQLKVMNQDVTGYFLELQKISWHHRWLSDHIKCMLRELMELWENDWVPQGSFDQIQKKMPQELTVEERLLPSVVVNVPQLQELTKSGDNLQPTYEVGSTAEDAKYQLYMYKLGVSFSSTSETMELMHNLSRKWRETAPEEVVKLVSQIAALPMTNYYEVLKVVTLIHKKALYNPGLSGELAVICKALNSLPSIPHELSRRNRMKYITFRSLMIQCCEAKVNDVEFQTNREMKLREIAAASDTVLKQQLQHSLEESKQRSRRIALANIRFMGELFNSAGYKINFKRIIKCLFEKSDEESIESICVLLTVVGKQMEEMNEDLTEHFRKLFEIREYNDIPHHIKSIVTDVILLREREWIPWMDPRTTENNPQSTDSTQSVTENVPELTAAPQQLVTQTAEQGAASLPVIEEKAPERMKVMRMNNKKVLEKLHKTAFKTVPNVLFRLVTHIDSVPLNNADELQSIVNLIHEMAVNEPEFSPQCAKVSKALAELQVPRESKSDQLEFVTFQQLLVKQCKIEVEKISKLRVKKEAILKDIEATDDPEVKKELKLKLEDEERSRMRAVGITRFVGELFKLWVVKTGSIFTIIRCLCKNGNEESLKCLCMLLTAVGKRMEDAHMDLSKRFASLKEISREDGISDEFKSMVQELIELRDNDWIPPSKSSSNRSRKKVDEPVPLSGAVNVTHKKGMESKKSKSSSRPQSVSSSGEDGAASLMELEEREKIFKKVHTKLNGLLEKEKSYELRLLVTRILALPMNCRDDLHGVVTYIYERAVNEPDLCILCAQICKVLTDIRMETLDFKRLLLGHCQRDFEKFTEVEPDAASVPAKKLKLTLLQVELKPQVRAIRNVRFFGELFNAGVLSFHIMNVCIKRLSEEKDELLMTCLCVLLTTIGHKMDNLQLNLSKHVTEMNKLLHNGEGESECFRVLLQHVSELAENNWIRQTGSHLKTVDQIQKLAEQTILNLDTQPPSLQQDDRRLHEKNHSDDILCDVASDTSSPLPQLASTENVAALLSAFQQKLTEELKYSKTCKMYKRVCQLLQKEESHRLIPIMTQIVALPIGDIHQLEAIVDLIYEKAMDEPDPFNCCAQLCKALSGIQVMGVDFRQLLLNRCQKEFRKSTRVEVKRGEIESVSDPERKNELQLELEEEEQRLRRRAVRNARFVGELFNLGIPSAKVIHKCMKQLLDKRDEVLLARLCVLLTTVAHTMESQKQSVSKYVEKMKIVTTMWGEEPLHVLLHDVIVSWQHDWFTPDSDLKSVDQIQEMAEKIVSDVPFQLESVPTSSCQKPVSRSSPDTSCSDAYSTTERDGSDVSSSCPESVSSNAAAAWCEIRHDTWE